VFPHIFEPQLPKLGVIFKNANYPSSHDREEGWPSDQENVAQHPLSRGRGGVSIDGTTAPRRRRHRQLAAQVFNLPGRAEFKVAWHSLIGAAPLLEGGEKQPATL